MSSKYASSDATSDVNASSSNTETTPGKPPVAKFRKRTSAGNCSTVQSSSDTDYLDGSLPDNATVAPAHTDSPLQNHNCDSEVHVEKNVSSALKESRDSTPSSDATFQAAKKDKCSAIVILKSGNLPMISCTLILPMQISRLILQLLCRE